MATRVTGIDNGIERIETETVKAAKTSVSGMKTLFDGSNTQLMVKDNVLYIAIPLDGKSAKKTAAQDKQGRARKVKTYTAAIPDRSRIKLQGREYSMGCWLIEKSEAEAPQIASL